VRMAERILGMGDVVSLVKERRAVWWDEARKNPRKIAKNEFGFDDFSQIQQVKKMGNMKDLVGMIPGASKAMKDVENWRWCFQTHWGHHTFDDTNRKNKPSVIDVKENLELQKVLEQKRTSESTDETVWANEQDDENDAGPGGKNLMKTMGGMKGMPGGMQG
jgi:signal recognition particle subunit SRP54